jgi:signal transduction histidine kinase/CheY-like chemotaxis protein
MSDQQVLDFLTNTDDSSGNFQVLLKSLTTQVKCDLITSFIKLGGSYDCVAMSTLQEFSCAFNPLVPIHEAVKSYSVSVKDHFGFSCSLYDIVNIMVRPIGTTPDDVVGVLVFCNFSGVIPQLLPKPCMQLCEILLRKQRILTMYQQLYQDTTHFSKDLFLANITHEIRTPLNGIIGYNQLLLQTNLNTVQTNYITRMNLCSVSLMKVINDVIDFSKLSSGNMTLNPECFNFVDVIYTVKSAVEAAYTTKKQRCSFAVRPKPQQFVVMDKQKLVQILVNLVSNAVKFTDINGTIDTTIELNPKTNCVSIKVEDNGVGISEDEQCKLFTTFVQCHSNITKSGSGLGLAIVKRLCDLMEGSVSVKSQYGTGTCFTCVLPFQPEEQVQLDNHQIVTILKGKQILVVDDNTDNRMILSDILLRWGVIPTVFSTAQESLNYVHHPNSHFDLGLIDICMPEVSGVELAKQINEFFPELPLIALSSLDLCYADNECFQSVLTKPINKVQLFSAITKALDSSTYLSNKTFIGDQVPRKLDQNDSAPEMRILIAEDYEDNRIVLSQILHNLGYKNITTANDGLETIRKITEATFDVLLLDLRMPIMDGYGVIEYMRRKQYKLPVIVAITACVMESERNKCAEAGVHYFINKPINVEELKHVLADVSIRVSDKDKKYE